MRHLLCLSCLISRYKQQTGAHHNVAVKSVSSTIPRPTSKQDGDIVVDTGAGRNLKPTSRGLVNPAPSQSRVVWGDGSVAKTSIQAELPGHDLTPFLVTPKVACTLISPGAELQGKSECYTFFDKHSFRISGLQTFKNKHNRLDARFIKQPEVKYIGTKHKRGDVYKAPNLSVFKPDEDRAWRLQQSKPVIRTIIAGPETPISPTAYAKTTTESVFAGFTATQKSIIHKSLIMEDFIPAYEYTVAELNANQRRVAIRLIRKHNQYGHPARYTLRCITTTKPHPIRERTRTACRPHVHLKFLPSRQK